LNLPCPVPDLIPQKGKMGFDQILFKTQKEDGQSMAVIREDHLFLDDRGRLSNPALIEYVNQLIAAAQGYNALATNEPVKKGLFVGLQDATFWDTVRLGDRLTLKKYLTEEVAQVNFVQGIVLREDRKVAEFITKIYELKDPAEFDSLTNLGPAVGPTDAGCFNDWQPPSFLDSNLQRQIFSCLREVKITTNLISFRIACPPEFVAFDGHFPGNPILPGVVLLEIAGLALELYISQPVVLNYVKRMKISSVVLPDQIIAGTVKIDSRDSSQLDFSAVFKGENNREISRFSGLCKKEDDHGEPET
jgi:3-hydroxymyristoyl/3-hydroxydecanoyl-(acyl carrier protein) dehydratase